MSSRATAVAEARNLLVHEGQKCTKSKIIGFRQSVPDNAERLTYAKNCRIWSCCSRKDLGNHFRNNIGNDIVVVMRETRNKNN